MNEVPETNSKETKECPVCGESIKAKAIKCRFCGEDLEAFASKHTNAEERNLFVGRAALLLSLGDYVISILFIGIPIFLFWFRKMYTK